MVNHFTLSRGVGIKRITLQRTGMPEQVKARENIEQSKLQAFLYLDGYFLEHYRTTESYAFNSDKI